MSTGRISTQTAAIGAIADPETLTLHPLTDLFPVMSEAEFSFLLRDIERHGIREPLVVVEGQILDGRHRWKAAKQLSLSTVPIREWSDSGDPLDGVVSLNLHRRHLDESQRAMVGARIKGLYEDQAKARQGARTDISANLRGSEKGKAATDAAAAVNVSTRSVESAAKVICDGTPELVSAVDAGLVPVSVAANIAKEGPDDQCAILDSKELPHRALRLHLTAKKHATLVQHNEPLPVSQRRYTVILADPPWRYKSSPAASRSVDYHYPTMAIEDIQKMPVGELADKNAVLFMWSTGPKLAESISVVKAWGFTHQTSAVWDKQRIGMGHYFRQQTEHLLLATKGKPLTPPYEARVSSLIQSPRSKHSVKPDEVYEIIECMYPGAPRIELFARNKREGWDAWGNEVQDE